VGQGVALRSLQALGAGHLDRRPVAPSRERFFHRTSVKVWTVPFGIEMDAAWKREERIRQLGPSYLFRKYNIHRFINILRRVTFLDPTVLQ
jgi:hypothetical protein